MDANPHPEVQPRYAAYCVANGMAPKEMLEADRKRWPGGSMVGYILWNQEGLSAFRKQHPEAFVGPHLVDRDGFTEFLFQLAAGNVESEPAHTGAVGLVAGSRTG